MATRLKEKDEEVIWKVFHKAKKHADEWLLSHNDEDTGTYIRNALAQEYNIPPQSITTQEEPSIYPLISKIKRILFPVGGPARANLSSELQRGGLGFNDAYKIACGNAQTREECRRKPIPVVSSPTRSVDLSVLFVGIIAAARQGGYTSTEITSAFHSALNNQAKNA